MPDADPLAPLLRLEGVPSAFAATRDGIDALLRDRGLRRTTPDLTTESLLRGAHASAVLEGSDSSLDTVLGHRVRYSPESIRQELAQTGFELEHLADFNRSAVPGWWWNGKVLKRRHFGRVQLKIFDTMVPVLRRLDRLIPWRGLGLVAVARRRDDAAG